MIGGLQGDFGNLDIKYLKQNIPEDLKMSVANIRKLQENTTACNILPSAWSDPGKRHGGYGHGLSRKLKRLISHPDMFAR